MWHQFFLWGLIDIKFTLTYEAYWPKERRQSFCKLKSRHWQNSNYQFCSLMLQESCTTACPYTSDAIIKVGWTVLLHPPCKSWSGCLWSSFFWFAYNALCGTSFEHEERVIKAAKKWLQHHNKTWYGSGICALVSNRHKAILVCRDYLE